jgi:hypothetical protein
VQAPHTMTSFAGQSGASILLKHMLTQLACSAAFLAASTPNNTEIQQLRRLLPQVHRSRRKPDQGRLRCCNRVA